MLAVILTMLLVGTVLGIGLIAYAMYLTWEPELRNNREDAFRFRR
jgi:hypothetical protein